MKVILLKDVKGVGRIHEVKEVADGYASNSLFPRKLAEIATPDKIAKLGAAKATHDKEVAAYEAELEAHIRSLADARIEISARATEKGGLFKSIGVPEIVRAIKDLGRFEIPATSIQLDHPLKTTGEHRVQLSHGKTTATAIIAISPFA